VLCVICKEVVQAGLISLADGRMEDTFIKGGYKDWKHALEIFQKHEGSHCHQFAAFQLAQKGNNINVQL
jgi:hypothetical protein